MVILQTPGTGFPDLEARIAFGLAWIAFQVEGVEVEIRRVPGAYQCRLTSRNLNGMNIGEKLDAAFAWTARRYLATESLYRIPGIQSQNRGKYRTIKEAKHGTELKPEFLSGELVSRFSHNYPPSLHRDVRKRHMCGHDLAAFGGSQGLVLGLSGHAGKPYERNFGGVRFNLGICSLCGVLSVLGNTWATFRCAMGPQGRASEQASLVLTPLPGQMVATDIEALFAAQKESEDLYLGPAVPTALAPLLFLSRFPFTAELLERAGAQLHVVRFDPAGQGRSRLGNQVNVEVSGFARFVSASSFNSVSVSRLLQRDVAGIEALQQLAIALGPGQVFGRQRAMARFAREYAAFSTWFMYPQTLRFFEEACEVSEVVTQSTALKRLVDILRYFARQGKYTYVDAFRTARDPSHLRDTISQVNRVINPVHREWEQARKRFRSMPEGERIRHEKEWRVRYDYVPRPLFQDELDEVWNMIDNEALREEIQLYVAAAAFTLSRRNSPGVVNEETAADAPSTEDALEEIIEDEDTDSNDEEA